MKEFAGSTGLVLNEPLLFEKGKRGRSAMSMVRRDVDYFPVNEELTGTGPDFPDLCEVEVVRHYTRLSTWNFGVDTGMYPLGSCTMKYNPKTNERQAGLPGFAGAHPLLPEELAQGLLKMMFELEHFLAEITGMEAVCLQPAAGAQGELAGMLLLNAYLKSKGRKCTKIIVPDTAHGTNPASASLCGFTPVKVGSNERGVLSLEAVAAAMDEDSAGIMVTNPNTLGFFEENIRGIAQIVHSRGGLVYADGANMNAVMGIVRMGDIGIDVLHLNLHKTFSTPHGGGGPGAGPLCVGKKLAPFLPIPRVIHDRGLFRLSSDYPLSIGKLHAFYGNVGIMIRAYSYILSLGPELKRVSRLAVLNANYIKERLRTILHLAYDRGCMHECVFSDKLQAPLKISTLEIAKRLIDYGFHPPTIYFPLVVSGALMIEPTETESKEELDLFVETIAQIVKEAGEKPELLRSAPLRTKVRRLDETGAARNPRLTFPFDDQSNKSG